MLTKGHMLRGPAVLLTLVASTGIAAADDTATEHKATEDSCAPPKEECPAPAAQAEPMPAPVAPQPTYEPTYQEPVQEQSIWMRYGVDVALGGGVEGFSQTEARDFTNDGGSWNVKVGIGNRYWVGGELSYIGSAQSIDAIGLDNNAVLVGNGAQGALRVNFTRDYSIQPFAYGGAAWRHYDITNSNFNTSDIANSDDVMELPVGGGIALNYRGFLLDARGEFRFAVAGDDLMPSLDNNNSSSMDRWGVNANIGYTF